MDVRPRDNSHADTQQQSSTSTERTDQYLTMSRDRLTRDSTVCKILKERDKWMSQTPKEDEEPHKEDEEPPKKRSKRNLPDFERTLIKWTKNRQGQGLAVTDEDLRERVQRFSFGRDDRAEITSDAWLWGFKCRNNLQAPRNEKGTASHAKSPHGEASLPPRVA